MCHNYTHNYILNSPSKNEDMIHALNCVNYRFILIKILFCISFQVDNSFVIAIDLVLLDLLCMFVV